MYLRGLREATAVVKPNTNLFHSEKIAPALQNRRHLATAIEYSCASANAVSTSAMLLLFGPTTLPPCCSGEGSSDESRNAQKCLFSLKM